VALVAVALVAQTPSGYQLPLWNAHSWTYPTLGPGFVVSGNVVSVPVTQGPAGPAGAVGSVGPAGPAGTFAAPPNSVWVLPEVMPTGSTLPVFQASCAMADIFRNGLLQTSTTEGGADYTMDPGTLIVTFAAGNAPGPGDLVKITYLCSK
jgi:hypothetical protein